MSRGSRSANVSRSRTIAIARVQFPIRALGYGRRVAIWTQGCRIHCPGCIVPETWTASAEHDVAVSDLLDTLRPWLAECDGVTISGGEPCDQPDAVRTLLDGLRDMIDGDILLYSGYPESIVRERHSAIVARVDAMIVEPFRASLPDERAFIGSANQRCIPLTALGAKRYGDLRAFKKRIDIGLDETGSRVLLAGVPRRGELTAVVNALREEGLHAETTHDAI